jgi:hypothetical protein
MNFLTLIEQNGLRRIATATPATSATEPVRASERVATVATVAVAKRTGQNCEISLLIPSLPDSSNWTDEDWLEFFCERQAIIEYDADQSRDRATDMAFLICIKGRSV